MWCVYSDQWPAADKNQFSTNTYLYEECLAPSPHSLGPFLSWHEVLQVWRGECAAPVPTFWYFNPNPHWKFMSHKCGPWVSLSMRLRHIQPMKNKGGKIQPIRSLLPYSLIDGNTAHQKCKFHRHYRHFEMIDSCRQFLSLKVVGGRLNCALWGPSQNEFWRSSGAFWGLLALAIWGPGFMSSHIFRSSLCWCPNPWKSSQYMGDGQTPNCKNNISSLCRKAWR